MAQNHIYQDHWVNTCQQERHREKRHVVMMNIVYRGQMAQEALSHP